MRDEPQNTDPQSCMICDLYAVIDRHLGPSGTDAIADYTADLVSVLPPRGHGLHKLGIWELTYRSPASLRTA